MTPITVDEEALRLAERATVVAGRKEHAPWLAGACPAIARELLRLHALLTAGRGDEEEPREVLAGRLIDAWCADKGKQIPWAKAIQIVAIVIKQPDAERDRLLRMGDEDGSCEMCGRRDAAPALPAESDHD